MNGFGLRVVSLWFRVQSSGLRVYLEEVRDQVEVEGIHRLVRPPPLPVGLGIGVWGLRFGVGDYDLWFRVSGQEITWRGSVARSPFGLNCKVVTVQKSRS